MKACQHKQGACHLESTVLQCEYTSTFEVAEFPHTQNACVFLATHLNVVNNGLQHDSKDCAGCWLPVVVGKAEARAMIRGDANCLGSSKGPVKQNSSIRIHYIRQHTTKDKHIEAAEYTLSKALERQAQQLNGCPATAV